MNHTTILKCASDELLKLKGETLNVLEIIKPPDLEYAIHLAKVNSKLSPIIANMVEFILANKLNNLSWDNGTWIRQDPGFPDLIFQSDMQPQPGFEIKTWFPLATEITARFKDSISVFKDDQIYVCMVVWLPEFILYGKPKVIGVWIGSARSLALARDTHYHNPPDYLIFEPEDTSLRTVNLQQSNTNGYKFQGSKEMLESAEEYILEWGENGASYQCTKEYQDKLKDLRSRFHYRLDTNFSKLDRINHEGLENFKKEILNTVVDGHTIADWSKLLLKDNETINNLIK